MQRWMMGTVVALFGLATAMAQQPQRKADKGIVLEGETKIRYILKQLELNHQQEQDAESLLAVYNESMKAESDQAFLVSRLMEIQSLLMKRDEAKAAGDTAKAEEYNQQMKALVPGLAPEKQFFEGMAPGLTDAQKTKLETVRERMSKDPDVSLKPVDVAQAARDQKLSAEQDEKVRKLETDFREEMTRARPQNLAERIDRVDQFTKKVREVLTGEQAKGFDKVIDRLRPPTPANLTSQPAPSVRVLKGNAVPIENPDVSGTHIYSPEEIAAARGNASQPAAGASPASQPAQKP